MRFLNGHFFIFENEVTGEIFIKLNDYNEKLVILFYARTVTISECDAQLHHLQPFPPFLYRFVGIQGKDFDGGQ